MASPLCCRRQVHVETLGKITWAVWLDPGGIRSCEVNPLTVVINLQGGSSVESSPLINIVPQCTSGGSFTANDWRVTPIPIRGEWSLYFFELVWARPIQVDRLHWWGTLRGGPGVIWEQFDNSDVMVKKSLESGDIDIITEVPTLLWKTMKGKPNVDAIAMDSFSFPPHWFQRESEQEIGCESSYNEI